MYLSSKRQAMVQAGMELDGLIRHIDNAADILSQAFNRHAQDIPAGTAYVLFDNYKKILDDGMLRAETHIASYSRLPKCLCDHFKSVKKRKAIMRGRLTKAQKRLALRAETAQASL